MMDIRTDNVAYFMQPRTPGKDYDSDTKLNLSPV